MSFFVNLIIFTLTLTSLSEAVNCPPDTSLTPCSCFRPWGGPASAIWIECKGDEMDQTQIEDFISLTRQTNGLSSNQLLHLYEFSLTYTNMTTLNLTPFVNTNITKFHLLDNLQLKSVVGVTNSTNATEVDQYRFYVEEFLIYTGLTDDQQVCQELFRFVYPEYVRSISFWSNKLMGLASPGEFVAGLSSLKNLHQFIVQYNPITEISGGQFKNQNKLEKLYLNENSIAKLGPQAFLFEAPPAGMAGQFFSIDLSGNQLTEEGIHENHSLETTGRRLYVNFEDNQFEYISAKNWLNYLLAPEGSQLTMRNNKFICDERMQWLRDLNVDGIMENQVYGVECTNDPGHDIFTTSLLP